MDGRTDGRKKRGVESRSTQFKTTLFVTKVISSNVNEKKNFRHTPYDRYEFMQYCKGFNLIPRNIHFSVFFVVVIKKL